MRPLKDWHFACNTALYLYRRAANNRLLTVDWPTLDGNTNVLRIRDAQMKALAISKRDQFILELQDHCQDYSPSLCATLNNNELAEAIRHGLTSADRHDFTQRGPTRFYIDLTILFGHGFASDPQCHWSHLALAKNPLLSEMDRSQDLYDVTREYLQQVHGENNRHLLSALIRVKALSKAVKTFNEVNLQQSALDWLTDIFPEKALAVGEVALDMLVLKGLEKAKIHYGLQRSQSQWVFILLVFFFGHECDTDPFYPWIARALQQRRSADETARDLESRSLIWLDAVLRNQQEIM